MKRLGMSAQIHSRPLIQGALMHKVHGDKAWDMPPFRRVQDSGIHWGLGSDATAVTTVQSVLHAELRDHRQDDRRPSRQPPDHHPRGSADRAHALERLSSCSRRANLGSLARGKYADLLVLDRDYLTVPADEIKDLKPLITMVGGKVVHDAMEVMLSCPGRGAARSDAPLIRDPGYFVDVKEPGSRVCSALLRTALRPGHARTTTPSRPWPSARRKCSSSRGMISTKLQGR